MPQIIDIILFVSGFISFLFSNIRTWLGFGKEDSKFSIFVKKHNKKFGIILIIASAITYVGNNLGKLSNPNGLEQTKGPEGQLTTKARSDAIDWEVNEGEAEEKELTKAFFRVAEHRFRSGEYTRAIDDYKISIELLPTMAAYFNLGTSYEFIFDYLNAKPVLEKGYQKSITRNHLPFQGAFLTKLGVVAGKQNLNEDGLMYLRQAIPILIRAKDSSQLAYSQKILGAIFFHMGGAFIDSAFSHHSRALEINQLIRNEEGIADNKLNIGTVLAVRKNYSEAKQLFLEALTFKRTNGDYLGEAYCLLNLGGLYAETGDTVSSLNTLLMAENVT